MLENEKPRVCRPWAIGLHPVRGDNSLGLGLLFLLICAGATVLAAPAPPPASLAPCWTNQHAETYFPADDPFFIGERVLLLRRGTYAYDLYLPADYDAHPSQRYPLAVVSAHLETEQQEALAEVFCARGWILLAPNLPPSLPEEKVLAALLCTYRAAMKDCRILPGVQLLAGYGTGAEIGAVFASPRPAFAAWIGDAVSGQSGSLAPLAKRPDLLLCLIERPSDEAAVEAFTQALGEETMVRTDRLDSEAPPLAPEALARALDWIREQLLFVRPPDGRFYEYAQAEYERSNEEERAALIERFHLRGQGSSINR